MIKMQMEENMIKMQSKEESKEEFLRSLSREQLETFVRNDEYRISSLEERLYLLSGCPQFGSSDGMDGTCVDCNIETPELSMRCRLFERAWKDSEKLTLKEPLWRKKQAAQKVKVQITADNSISYACPSCTHALPYFKEQNGEMYISYCPYCGQALELETNNVCQTNAVQETQTPSEKSDGTNTYILKISFPWDPYKWDCDSAEGLFQICTPKDITLHHVQLALNAAHEYLCKSKDGEESLYDIGGQMPVTLVRYVCDINGWEWDNATIVPDATLEFDEEEENESQNDD